MVGVGPELVPVLPGAVEIEAGLSLVAEAAQLTLHRCEDTVSGAHTRTFYRILFFVHLNCEGSSNC